MTNATIRFPFRPQGLPDATRDEMFECNQVRLNLRNLYPQDEDGHIRVTDNPRTTQLLSQIDLARDITENRGIVVSLTPQTEISVGVMVKALYNAVDLCDRTDRRLEDYFLLRYASRNHPPDDIPPHRRDLYRDFKAAQAICRHHIHLQEMCGNEPVLPPVQLPAKPDQPRL